MNTVHPIVFQTTIVMIAAAISESFSVDEQAMIGAFLSTLGDMISFNSAYLSYIQTDSSNNQGNHRAEEDQYDLLKKSIQKIEEEIEKMKQ